MNIRSTKFFMLALIVVIIAGAASAFAATNTFPTGGGYAGDGSAAISGYTVSTVRYALDTADPRYIHTVTFTLNHAATDVRVKLVATGTAFTTCSISGGTAVTCTFPAAAAAGSITALAADELTVIAVE